MTMKEEEIVIPIRFFVKVGKTSFRLGGPAHADISIKAKCPIFLAYFYLASKFAFMGLKKILA
jgi:hypothetical protein